MNQVAELPAGRITLAAFEKIANRCGTIVKRVRTAMLKPDSKKKPPMYQAAQMAAMMDLDVKQVDYRAKKGDLPSSGFSAGGSRRLFSVSDARVWARSLRWAKMRPEGQEGVVITVANFKGGVSKTTTAVTLAQGLALRGHKVLVIDADPQGSATNLFGLIPEVEVDPAQTLEPLCGGQIDTVSGLPISTYWDGVDLIPAHGSLFSAEFLLPARQLENRGFEFWNVLSNGLAQAKTEYDVIVIDTPPSMSYLAINAIMAADGMLIPLPPNGLDFLSAAQFWRLVTELTGGLQKHGSKEKAFDFVNVLLTKVDPDDTASPIVRDWIYSAYQDMVLPVEIPKTATANSASAEFGTVYDQARRRATPAYDRMVEAMEQQICNAWRNRRIAAGEVV